VHQALCPSPSWSGANLDHRSASGAVFEAFRAWRKCWALRDIRLSLAGHFSLARIWISAVLGGSGTLLRRRTPPGNGLAWSLLLISAVWGPSASGSAAQLVNGSGAKRFSRDADQRPNGSAGQWLSRSASDPQRLSCLTGPLEKLHGSSARFGWPRLGGRGDLNPWSHPADSVSCGCHSGAGQGDWGTSSHRAGADFGAGAAEALGPAALRPGRG